MIDTNILTLLTVLLSTNTEEVVTMVPITNRVRMVREHHVATIVYRGSTNSGIVWMTNWPISTPPNRSTMAPLVPPYPFQPPLPPEPVLKPAKTKVAAWSGPPVAFVENSVAENVTRVWLSRGARTRPKLSAPSATLRNAAVIVVPGPHGVIHPVTPVPPEPAKWMQADWSNWTVHGDIQIQMAGNPPWAWQNWASIPAANWLPGPGIVLQVGWQITDEQGVPFKGAEYQRIVIAQ